METRLWRVRFEHKDWGTVEDVFLTIDARFRLKDYVEYLACVEFAKQGRNPAMYKTIYIKRVKQ